MGSQSRTRLKQLSARALAFSDILLNTGHSCKVTKTNLHVVFKCKETFYMLKKLFICGMPDLLDLAYGHLVAACGI